MEQHKEAIGPPFYLLPSHFNEQKADQSCFTPGGLEGGGSKFSLKGTPVLFTAPHNPMLGASCISCVMLGWLWVRH